MAFDGHVLALRRDDGTRAWHREVRGFPARLAAVGERVVVLGGSLACLDAATGRTIWNLNPPPVGDTLLVHGEHVFVGGNGKLACISLETGDTVWRDDFKAMGMGDVALAVEGAAAHSARAEALPGHRSFRWKGMNEPALPATNPFS